MNKFNLISKWRIWTAISAGIVLLGVVFFAVFNFNVGFDFTLSGSVDVEIGTYLYTHEDSYEDIEAIVLEVLDEMNISYSTPQKLNQGSALVGVRVKFSGIVNGNKATEEQLNVIGRLINGRQTDENLLEDIEIVYTRATGEDVAKIKSLLSGTVAYDKLNAAGDFSKGSAAVSYKGIYDRVADKDIKIEDLDGTEVNYPMSSLKITAGAMTNGFDFRVFWNYLLVLGIALVAVFLYSFWRAGIKNAITAAIVVVHNSILLVALAAITRVVINASFAGVLGVVAACTYYSLALLFAKIKENRSKSQNADWTETELVENTIAENFIRIKSVFISIFLVLAFILVAALITGVAGIVQFVLPVIIGLVVSTFGILFIAPILLIALNKRK